MWCAGVWWRRFHPHTHTPTHPHIAGGPLMNGNDQESNGSRLTRRGLVRRTLGAGAAVALPWIIPSRAWGADSVPPSERITLGVIGYGPRCTQVLGSMIAEPDVQVLAVADVQASRRQKCKET